MFTVSEQERSSETGCFEVKASRGHQNLINKALLNPSVKGKLLCFDWDFPPLQL